MFQGVRQMNESIQNFKMPRYREIPNVGLYLEQTVKYINDCLAPLEISITNSMLSNYVKKGYVDRPVKKQYNADQIAYLLFIAVGKQVLSMENISTLFQLQKRTYSLETAYDYFCTELENMLRAVFSQDMPPLDMEGTMPFAKKTLRSFIIAISHVIYLNDCFRSLEA